MVDALNIAELQQAIDEQAETLVGGEPAGRGVRGEQQAGVREVRHDVADGSRGERHGQAAGKGAGADGFAGGDVLFDNFAQHGGRTSVEARRQGGRRGRDVVGGQGQQLQLQNLEYAKMVNQSFHSDVELQHQDVEYA